MKWLEYQFAHPAVFSYCFAGCEQAGLRFRAWIRYGC